MLDVSPLFFDDNGRQVFLNRGIGTTIIESHHLMGAVKIAQDFLLPNLARQLILFNIKLSRWIGNIWTIKIIGLLWFEHGFRGDLFIENTKAPCDIFKI
jgi:hypothetical protein